PIPLLRLRPPPRSTLSPYTTLFRSYRAGDRFACLCRWLGRRGTGDLATPAKEDRRHQHHGAAPAIEGFGERAPSGEPRRFRACRDRKSTRLNSSHVKISYAVFCLKK